MVRVIAHRGASAAAPENTVEAFRLAAELGADWVELDVRRTADDAAIVHHDAHLPDGRAIVELTRADLPAHVPDLAEALDACGALSVNIEIKNVPVDPDFDPDQRVAQWVIDEVAARDADGRTLVSCFHRQTLDEVHRLRPSLPTAFLHGGVDQPWTELAADVAGGGHVALHPWFGLADEAYLAAAREVGLEVNVWTVDDPDHMAVLVARGVDGLCTNVPDIARKVIDSAP